MDKLEQLQKEVTRQAEQINQLKAKLDLILDIEQEETDILNDIYESETVTVKPKHPNQIKQY